MSEHYRRDGTPCDLMEWATQFEDIDTRRVAETTLPDGKWVSTVFLGLNHQFGAGPPLIFETMVFDSKDSMQEVDTERYSTEEQAVAGHAVLVEKWSKQQ